MQLNIAKFELLNDFSNPLQSNDGGLSKPVLGEFGRFCQKSYFDKIDQCLEPFHRVFRSNPADMELCDLYIQERVVLYIYVKCRIYYLLKISRDLFIKISVHI